MKLENQILSIKQVRELQELGFDVEKYSSIKSNGRKVVAEDDFYIGAAPLFPTMTIGDIINVLPYSIETYHKKDFETYTTTYFLKINQLIVSYVNPHIGAVLIAFSEKKLINTLFRMLNFMIKTGYINK